MRLFCELAREFVELMRIAGILNGYEDGTFRPQGNATRAEAAKLFSLFRALLRPHALM